MITYSNRRLSYAQAYYDEIYDASRTGVDIVKEIQFSNKRHGSHKSFTLHIDLTQNDDTIFSAFEKNTKYEINRAKNKDGITVRDLVLPTEKQSFYDYYAEFSKSKKLPPLGEREIDLLIDSGMFRIRIASDENNETLVYHTYICTNGRVRLAHSVSMFRANADSARKNLIGRANRYLHWDDIELFKREGYHIYDFGGINPDKTNDETMAINRFKECFGGKPVSEYNSLVPCTLKGFFFVIYKMIKDWHR